MKTLKNIRQEIDTIDDMILDLIAKRRNVVRQVGEIKKITGAPIRDNDREHEKIDSMIKRGKTLDIPEKIITTIWKIFFTDAYEIEK